MAFLNASGNPVATKPTTVQIDLPCEAATDASAAAPNFLAIIMAVGALIAAVKSGNPAAIMAAIQALLNAIKGG